MQKFIITGGQPLIGEVRIAGAKNAVRKMMAAAALTDEAGVLHNVPRISDVMIMRETMSDIGFDVRRVGGDSLRITAQDANWLFVPLEAAAKMRSSFILLGPLLTRFGRVIISNPGGDRIGRRPVDLHVFAMESLGAEVEYKNGYYFASAPSGLRGARIAFPYVTVMGTENALLAATLARATTLIENAAQEPEVDDLIAMLSSMGAQISRVAPHRIEVEGVTSLRGAEHRVIGDRLEAGTFAIAAATTGGDVTIRGVNPGHLGAFLEVLDCMGVPVEILAPSDSAADPDADAAIAADAGSAADPDAESAADADSAADGDSAADAGLRVRAAASYAPAAVETQPYPGFATDLQAPLAVHMTQADGVSTIHETIYEDRLDYTTELCKMGAVVEVLDERRCSIAGPTPLHGREVSIADLRAGATLVLAALAAAETSVISGVEHVDRGYEQIESKLVALGAQIHRIDA
jgi:UDP-N-acetylglucosamine 1-carboxyvinyltransferase